MKFNTSSFREYLGESTKLNKDFILNITGIDFVIEREFHVRQPRGNTKFPRDAGMSMNKYRVILEKALPLMSKDDTYSITWSSNGKNNIISLTRINNKFSIFGAIIKSEESVDKLYKKAVNRINLGTINF
jgi:hypothetical protein